MEGSTVIPFDVRGIQICIFTCASAGIKTWPLSRTRQQTKRRLSRYRRVLRQSK